MAELDWQPKFIRAVKLMGHKAQRINSGCVPKRGGGRFRATEAGTSDTFIVIRGGHILWLELKEPGKPLNDDQRRWHAEMKRLGADVDVAEGFDEAIRKVKERADER